MMPECEFLFSAVFPFQKFTDEIFSELDGYKIQTNMTLATIGDGER